MPAREQVFRVIAGENALIDLVIEPHVEQAILPGGMSPGQELGREDGRAGFTAPGTSVRRIRANTPPAGDPRRQLGVATPTRSPALPV